MTGRVQELFVRSDGREIRASHDIVEAVAASTSSHFEDPLDEPCWGAALSVYALRSATSYGIGDLGDLRSAARILAGLGARFCTISPVGMWSALPTFEYYPYSPGSRLFIDPVYLSLPHLGIRPDSTQPTTWQEARNGKLALIQALVLDHPEYLRADDFRLWLQAQPRARAAGLYIIEACDGRIQTRTAQEASDRAKGLDDAGLIADPRTWSWAAYQAERQMAAVNRELNVYGDIPVGVASPGLDTLIWPEEIAVEFRLGAPPDSVHLKPQIWDVHGWMPSALARSGYQPYRDTIWSNLAATSGVRIDHALALARQFFVGADDQSGVYVESDMHPLVEALLDVVSAQGAYVYLETLGTPVPQLEEMLDAYGVPRYRLLLADPAASSQARPEDLVALTNHDTPTLRGLWSGADLRAQHALGFHGDDEAQRELLAELRRQTGSPTTFEEFQLRLYELLAQCPARRVALHVEDALGQSFRFHLPGHPNGPNYQRPGEVPVELWGNSPTLRHLSEVMSAHGASV